jgi:hypothetical protein
LSLLNLLSSAEESLVPTRSKALVLGSSLVIATLVSYCTNPWVVWSTDYIIYYVALLDEVVQVASQDAITTAKELALKEVK